MGRGAVSLEVVGELKKWKKGKKGCKKLTSIRGLQAAEMRSEKICADR